MKFIRGALVNKNANTGEYSRTKLNDSLPVPSFLPSVQALLELVFGVMVVIKASSQGSIV